MRRISKRRIRLANRRRKPSKLEILVATQLKGLGLEFKREYPVGECHVDFAVAGDFPNGYLLIEANGCYFHSCPRCYPDGGRRKTAAKKDWRRLRFLTSRGYRILVLWECDLEANQAREMRKILNLVKGRQGAESVLWSAG